MKNVASRRVFAPLAYVACLLASPAFAQVGPIQPVLVLEDGSPESPHIRPDLPENYAISVDVGVATDGRVTSAVVSDSSNNAIADKLAVDEIRSRKFLPALDAKGRPIAGAAKVTVSMFKRGARKVVKVIVKPPALNAETERVKKMMCADFIWEVERLHQEADVGDASYEVMPYTSARMYVAQKRVSSDAQDKFWDAWPDAMRKVVDRCEKDQLKFFYADVLVPTLDGVVPETDSTVAAAGK